MTLKITATELQAQVQPPSSKHPCENLKALAFKLTTSQNLTPILHLNIFCKKTGSVTFSRKTLGRQTLGRKADYKNRLVSQ
jgi:hypothetical protein